MATIQPASPVPPRLERAFTHLEDWRSTRRRGRIPTRLWDEAVDVAREYGVKRTAELLALDAVTLQRKIGGSSAPPAIEEFATFVDVTPQRPPSTTMEGFAEFEDRCGRKLRVRWHGEPPDLFELARGFFGSRR
jgi:hypothetical protein